MNKFNINDKVNVNIEGIEVPATISDIFEISLTEIGYEVEYYDHKKEVVGENQISKNE